VRSVAERAMNATAIVDEAMQAGLDGSHPVTLQAKMLPVQAPEAQGPRSIGRCRVHATPSDVADLGCPLGRARPGRL
jgi:hypothetical protein